MCSGLSVPSHYCREVEPLKIFNVVVAGLGGQGNLLLSQLIAMVARREGFDVQTGETLGMAQRGGHVNSFVRYGHEVHTPMVPDHEAHVLIALEPVEALRSIRYVGDDTKILLNTKTRPPLSVSLGETKYPNVNDIETALKSMGAEVFAFDAFELAERAGETKSVNVVMLGGMATLGNSSVKVENFKEALKEVVSEKLLQVNLQAFDFGYDAVASLKSERDKHY